MVQYIIINATALKGSGALSILEQFIEEIPPEKYEYIVFTNSTVSVLSSQANVRIIPKKIKSFRQRFIWDSFGIRNWLKMNKIKPIASLSLQNTNFRINEPVSNFVYFHNAIPLSDGKWSLFNKDERELWFYKTIYPFFIRLYLNSRTEVFVQTRYIKERFSENFNFPLERIHVVIPKIRMEKNIKTKDYLLDKKRVNLFYPATTFKFKNHYTLIKAIGLLECGIQERITLHLTCKELELPFKIDYSSIGFEINFMGNVAFGKVLQLYEEADALLFPSYIETFGLPLIEAASYGMPIIASDLPFAREALGNYAGAKFITYDDVTSWKNAILELFMMRGHRFSPLVIDISSSWCELFRIIDDKISSGSK
jgi:glycosyltransferase involved in cell wall biosynthesis